MFQTKLAPENKPLVLLKRTFLIVVVGLFVVGAISSYRAYVQVRSLEVEAGPTLSVGSNIKTSVVGSGRTQVDVTVELIQGNQKRNLSWIHLPGNELAFFDPRTQSAAKTEIITNEHLVGFQTGQATIRATAVGRHQWMRLPPPTVREVSVEIRTQ